MCREHSKAGHLSTPPLPLEPRESLLSSPSTASDEFPATQDAEVAAEQEYVSMLYSRLDDLREQAGERLGEALRQTGGTPAERSQRESAIAMYAEQQAQFGAVENGLCFGRLDLMPGDQLHIGRIGIFDEKRDYEPMLLDWRA